jgi:uncharacterized protein (DUF1697 family)
VTGWVALLRGINLGAHNRIPMAGLRETFQAAGCEDVRTYIASGNVVFRHERSRRAALAEELRAAIAAAFDVDTPVILRTFTQMRKAASLAPFGDDNAHTYVTFLAEKPAAAAVEQLAGLDTGPDRAELIGEDLFLHLPNGLANATISFPRAEKAIGVPGTNRNWRTVTKLADMTRA